MANTRSSFRFIHTADIHLDRALRGLVLQSALAPELVTATRTAFSRLVDAAIEEEVAFVIVAGDLYDADWKDFQTGYFMVSEMARLKRAGIRVFLLYGNHDAEQEMTKKLVLPDNVFCFGSTNANSVTIEDLKVVLHGQSFKRTATNENIASRYPAAVPGYVNIGVLHTSLQGRPPHAPYAPCSLDDLKNKGYQYWALGHVHQYQMVCEDPWVVFPGNLQGLHVNEPGAKGAVIAQVDDGIVARPERLCVDVLRWERADVDVAGAETIEDVARRAGKVFQAIVEQTDGRAVCCRVVLKGRAPAHGELYARGIQLRAEIVGQAVIAAQDGLLVESVRLQTEPMLSAEEIVTRGDAVAELQGLLGEADKDGAFLESLKHEFDILLGKIPPDLWAQEMPALVDVRDGRLADLVASVSAGVLDCVSREV